MVIVRVPDVALTVVSTVIGSSVVPVVTELDPLAPVASASLPDIVLPLPEIVAGFEPLTPEASASLPDIALPDIALPLPEIVAGFEPLTPEASTSLPDIADPLPSTNVEPET